MPSRALTCLSILGCSAAASCVEYVVTQSSAGQLLYAACISLLQGFRDIVKQSLMSSGGDMMPTPDLEKHVFCRVLSDRGTVELNVDG